MAVRHRHTTDTHAYAAPRLRQAAPRLRDVSASVDEPTEERRVRDSGGPDDRAFYRCGCGTAFRADVSTSVSCPGCGGEQAW